MASPEEHLRALQALGIIEPEPEVPETDDGFPNFDGGARPLPDLEPDPVGDHTS